MTPLHQEKFNELRSTNLEIYEARWCNFGGKSAKLTPLISIRLERKFYEQLYIPILEMRVPARHSNDAPSSQ